jgi:hypothetical protein
MGRSCFIATLGILFLPSLARAAPDYDPESEAWNGLSALIALADEEGVDLEPVEALDLARLAPADGLLILYPTKALPTASLLAFVRAGGAVALADDFGAGGALLHRFAIERVPPPIERAARLHGNRALLLARPRGAHPLAAGVGALLTNHPVALVHPDLEPVFAFDDEGREGLVLSGTVGAGKLVAIGDPSVFINRMMALEGNRRFAAGVLHLLADRGGHVFVVSRDARLDGDAGADPEASPFATIDEFLRALAGADLPAAGLGVATLVLCGIFAAFASGAMSLREPYAARTILPPAREGGGFSGWLRFDLDHSRNLLHPTLMYKHELEASLAALLGLPEPPSVSALVAKLEARRLPATTRRDARALLEELAALEEDEHAEGGAPHVSGKRFVALRERGEALVAALRAPGGGA